jgi:1-acyl-sn-glycerol-3-phosphate acyltransferase
LIVLSRFILVVRSAAFNVAFFAMTIGALLTTWPVLLVPRPQPALWVARNWGLLTFVLLRVLVGLRVEIRGDVARIAGPALIASNHQSAWDTIVFLWLCRLPTYAMKKELMAIPIFGWMAKRQGHIAVDRKAGAAAFRRLQRQAGAALAAGRQIVLFPEGTRVAPDQRRPYQPGIAGLYAALRAPVVPVAVNSGLFWARRSFIKRPGTIVLEILPEIPAGLERGAFLSELELRISSAAGRLIAEARKADPRL